MPSSPPSICARAGCQALTVSGSRWCLAHQATTAQAKATANKERGSAHARGYTAEWRRAARLFLAINPVCRGTDCGRLAELVDHRIPHRGDRTLFWDQANWQPLCSRCHNSKTAREDGGFGNTRRPAQPPT